MIAYLTARDVLSLPWKKNPKGLRDKPDVYRVVDRATGEELYIGQSIDVGTRLCPSVHPVFRRAKHDVYYLPEASKDERGWMEVRFIELLKPSRNIRRGQMKARLSEEAVGVFYDWIFENK